jgi:hypothetical protein
MTKSRWMVIMNSTNRMSNEHAVTWKLSILPFYLIGGGIPRS